MQYATLCPDDDDDDYGDEDVDSTRRPSVRQSSCSTGSKVA